MDESYTGNVVFREYFDGRNEMSRPLFEDGFDIILPSNNMVSILKRLYQKTTFHLTKSQQGVMLLGLLAKE
jgi:hypothetical protein